MLKHKELQIDDMVLCFDGEIATTGCFIAGNSYRVARITKVNALKAKATDMNARLRVPAVAAPDDAPVPARLTMPRAEKKLPKVSHNISSVQLTCEAGCEHNIDYYNLTTYFRIPQIAVRNLPSWWFL